MIDYAPPKRCRTRRTLLLVASGLAFAVSSCVTFEMKDVPFSGPEPTIRRVRDPNVPRGVVQIFGIPRNTRLRSACGSHGS